MRIDVGSVMPMSGEVSFIEFLSSEFIPTPFEHPMHIIAKIPFLVMFQCRATVTDSGPVLNLYCNFCMDSRSRLNVTFAD